jgi:hypothetical protein
MPGEISTMRLLAKSGSTSGAPSTLNELACPFEPVVDHKFSWALVLVRACVPADPSGMTMPP